MSDNSNIPLNILKDRKSLVQSISFLLIAVMIFIPPAVLSMDAAVEQRVILVRYWHFITAGFFAFALPHLLYPVDRMGWVQQINPPAGTLLRLQLSSLSTILLVFAFSYVVIAFFDPLNPTGSLETKLFLLAESWVYLAAIAMYALFRYSLIGNSSQQWSEGKRGGRFMDAMAQAGQTSATPAGMYPTFGATIGIAGIGMLLVVFQAYLSAISPLFSYLIYPILLLYGGIKLFGLLGSYDRHLYHTSSFYDELFRNPGSHRKEGREPVDYKAIYWVPGIFKPAVWAMTIQMDRRLPFGRIMLLLVLLLWTLLYVDLSGVVFNTAVILVIFVKNAAVFISTSTRLAPLPFQIVQHSATSWVFSRFFLNIRWTLPLLLALLIAALFSGSVTYTEAFAWSLIDIFVAFITALITTLTHEANFRKRYA